MSSRFVLAIFLLVPAFVAAQDDGLSESGPEASCVVNDEIQGLLLVDEQNWAFILEDGTLLLNVMTRVCPASVVSFISRYNLLRRLPVQRMRGMVDLEAMLDGRPQPYQRALGLFRMNRNARNFCAGDDVAFRSLENSVPGTFCTLGEFYELSSEEAERLLVDPLAVISTVTANPDRASQAGPGED